MGFTSQSFKHRNSGPSNPKPSAMVLGWRHSRPRLLADPSTWSTSAGSPGEIIPGRCDEFCALNDTLIIMHHDHDVEVLGGIFITGWWCNNHLEKYEFVNGKDDPFFIMENKSYVWNHQPDYYSLFFFVVYYICYMIICPWYDRRIWPCSERSRLIREHFHNIPGRAHQNSWFRKMIGYLDVHPT